MSRRAAALLLAVLLAAVAALLFVNRGGFPRLGRRGPRPFLRVTPAPAIPLTAAPGTTPAATVEQIRITLFFPDAEGQLLHPEERDVPKPPSGAAFVRVLFDELQKGPRRDGLMAAIPDRIHLRNAFLLPDGQVVLDLAVDAGLAFGSDEELAIVASLVDTTLQNVAETSRVRILVNGEPADTLGGHVDLTRPLAYIRGVLEPPGVETPPATPSPGPATTLTPSPAPSLTPSPVPTATVRPARAGAPSRTARP
ncbi:MAG: GerMN domain-containing protein [Syntrophomonadaceae bacterium]